MFVSLIFLPRDHKLKDIMNQQLDERFSPHFEFLVSRINPK